MLGIFSDQERALPPSKKIRELTFVVKKRAMILSGVANLRVWARKLKIKCRPCSCPRPQIYSSLFPTSETPRRMGTSVGRSDFWDCLGGQVLVMIG